MHATTEDTALTRSALAYVAELYRELTGIEMMPDLQENPSAGHLGLASSARYIG